MIIYEHEEKLDRIQYNKIQFTLKDSYQEDEDRHGFFGATVGSALSYTCSNCRCVIDPKNVYSSEYSRIITGYSVKYELVKNVQNQDILACTLINHLRVRYNSSNSNTLLKMCSSWGVT